MTEKIDFSLFSNSNILVCGDLMLDRYWHGAVSRISPEAPVPVVNVNNNKVSAGGAANVALNLSAMNCGVSILGYIGADNEGQELLSLLQQEKIHTYCIEQAALPTIQKLRVMGHNQQLIRMDFEQSFASVSSTALLQQFQQQLALHDVVVLSDYNKGTLSCIEQLISMAREHSKPIIIDPKVSDIARYRGATMLTPNLKEFEAIVGQCDDYLQMEQKARQLIDQYDFQAVLITLGAEGMLLCMRDQSVQRFFVQSTEVYDVTGAGDTVVAVLAAAMAVNLAMPVAVKLANIAAGIVVRKVGSATASTAEIARILDGDHAIDDRILTENNLLTVVDELRRRGKKVVMTNGCFDILHAGHVAYLESARQLGDYLLVAVNTDCSVAALKGDDRPFNELAARMQVLAALRAVDGVIAFSEKTPARLIDLVAPDVLVKGSDYKVNEIAGSESVLENGGSVKTVALKSGFSTTHLVNKIQQAVVV